jgi:hypothetical protein
VRDFSLSQLVTPPRDRLSSHLSSLLIKATSEKGVIERRKLEKKENLEGKATKPMRRNTWF